MLQRLVPTTQLILIFFAFITCLKCTTAQASALPASNGLGANSVADTVPTAAPTAADTVPIPAPPPTDVIGIDTVAFQAPNMTATSTTGDRPSTTNPTATDSMQQQPTAASPAAADAANGTNPQSSVTAEGASLPNEPISQAEAQLMHEDLQKLLKSEGTNFTAAGSETGIYQGLLDVHNQYRVRHQGSVLGWHATLASNAAGYASRCIFAHDPNRNGGENIYVTSSRDVSYALGQAGTLWYNEVTDYDFNTGGVRSGRPSNSMIGHFTQMVWLGSNLIGCAAAVCNYGITNFQAGTIVVCRYSPAGNVIGQFVQNVRPATSSSSSTPSYTPGPAPSTSYSNGYPNQATVVATNGQAFQGPGCKSSPDQRYWLCIWDTGEAIFYQGQTPRWRTNTSGSQKPYKLVVYSNGNIYLNNVYNQYVWQSGTGRGTPPHRLLLQNDGRLVLYDANNYAIWSVS